MSSLLESLKAVLKRDGKRLEDIEYCICRIKVARAGSSRNLAVRHVKPSCFLEAASALECGSDCGSVDPALCISVKDGTRYCWNAESRGECWMRRPDLHSGCRKPLIEVPPEDIVLLRNAEDGSLTDEA